MFISEVEEEYVVCLAINGFLDGVWLICNKRCEYAVVAHTGYNVVPIGFSQIQVGFFSEEKDSFEFPV